MNILEKLQGNLYGNCKVDKIILAIICLSLFTRKTAFHYLLIIYFIVNVMSQNFKGIEQSYYYEGYETK